MYNSVTKWRENTSTKLLAGNRKGTGIEKHYKEGFPAG